MAPSSTTKNRSARRAGELVEAWAGLLRFVVFSRKEDLCALSADGKAWVKSKEQVGLWLSLQRASCLARMKSHVPCA